METRTMLKGESIQLLPFCSKDWTSVARWFYSEEYKDFFRQFTRMLTEDELKLYDKLVQGEVFMIHSLADSQVVGLVQILPGIKRNKAGFIGILVDKAYQNKQIACEALPLFMDYVFNRQGYNKVVFEILESNEHLKKNLDKNGCYKEGKLLQECFMDGKFVNELRYSMSAYYFNKNKSKIGKGV